MHLNGRVICVTCRMIGDKVKIKQSVCLSLLAGGQARWLGYRSLAGGLSLPCARSKVDRWPLSG